MTLNLSDKDKKTLSAIGRGVYGRDLISILNRSKVSLSSIDDITADYGTQVVGRQLFNQYVKTIVDALSTEERKERIVEPEDYR